MNKSESANLKFSLLGHTLPVLVILLVAGGFYCLNGGLNPSSIGLNSSPEKVRLGGDYYITVSLVEVSSQMPDGSKWDSYNSSAPDVFFEIDWRGHRAFKSSTKDNSLLAVWSEAEIDLREIALTGKKTSSDDVIKAARINIHQNESILIKIFDEDLLGQKDLVIEKSFLASDFQVGENVFFFEDGPIKRLIVMVKPINQEDLSA